MGIPTFHVSISTVWKGTETANLHSAFYHETFESPNARFYKRHKMTLQAVEQSSSELDIGLTSLPGITPPQKPTSVQHWPCAAPRLIARFSTVVVGGIELSGISTRVVTPPDSAALVPVQKPSQSVRPGSFKCTCALEGKKGMSYRSRLSKTRERLTLRAQAG